MWTPTLDPVLVEIFGLEIRYYGLVYVLGFVLGILWLLYYRRELNLSKDDVYDLVFYVMVGVLLGSRLFHVVFWEPAYYLSLPWKVFYVWEGGMAFHGGLVGSVLGAYLYCRKKKLSFFRVADILSVPAVIALAFGRLANFVNGELVGRVTDVSWCVNFGDGLCRHPYQLYSAAKRFVVAGVLFGIQQVWTFKEGTIFWLTLLLLNVGRFFLDYYREDTLYWSLTMGQWMALVVVLVSGVMLFRLYKDGLTLVKRE